MAQDVTVTILCTNHPKSSSPGEAQSSTVFEQVDTTGSAAPDTTPTTPAGTLAFTDQDTGDAHTVAVSLASTSGASVPAATQADLAAALTTTLHRFHGDGQRQYRLELCHRRPTSSTISRPMRC